MDLDIYKRLADLEKWQQSLASMELSRPIYAIYNTNAGQSITNSTTTIVNFEDLVSDPDGLVTTGSNWKFTCPIAGAYIVIAINTFASSATWALGERAFSQVFVNGSAQIFIDRNDNLSGAASQFMLIHGSGLVVCSAGDTIDIRTFQGSGGTLALETTASLNQVFIARIN